MRSTNGKRVRKYVYDVRLGDNKAAALYRGNEKLWPTLSDTVYSCVLDVNELEGSVNRAWWLHALDAVSKGVGSECYMKLRAGGREYMLGATFGNWYLAEYDGRATVVFGDNGPLWEKLQPGDEVSVELRVPARESAEFEGQSVCYLPYLTNTRMRVSFTKWKKKRHAGRRFEVGASAGNVVHYGGYCETSEHKRGNKTRVLPSNTHKWYNRVYNNNMVVGETSLAIDTAPIGSGGGPGGGVTFLWPGFITRLRFKVSAVTRHG